MASNSEKQGGCGGCIGAILLIAVLLTAWLAIQGVDFPGSNQIRQISETATDRIGNLLEGKTYTSEERENFPNPVLRHTDLKQLMLTLTNQRRAEAGSPPVKLGTNPAAQLHAEAALEGCYGSHWDQWGLKPNQRYTLTGGTGADGENFSGSDYCIKLGDNYASIASMNEKVEETVTSWMESPGHRRTLLHPVYTTLNIGVAYDRYNASLVHQFSTDYVRYIKTPAISADGILELEAAVSNATLNIGNTAIVTIGYDPPPKAMTNGQLASTYSLCNPIRVAYIMKPLADGRYYSGPEVQTRNTAVKCIDPYQTDPGKPAPQSRPEARQTWLEAKNASAVPFEMNHKVRRIIALEMETTESRLKVKADIGKTLEEHGPGIYEITIWGSPLHIQDTNPISQRSIFYLTSPPAGNPYSAYER